jgi:hypothetical protein
MLPLEQVPLSIRKAVASSVPFARLAGGASSFQLPEAERTQIENLAKSFLGRLPDAVQASSSAENLDLFVADQARVGQALVSALFTAPLSAVGQNLLTRALAETSASRCASCPGRKTAGAGICNDSPSDHSTIAGGAACLAVVHDAFDFARALAEHMLEDAFGIAFPLDIRLKTSFLLSGDLTASNRHDDGEHPVDVVDISLPRWGFDFPSLARLPYLFAHEIICHAIQGRAGFDGTRRAGSGECPWSEGWMDRLAAEAVEEMLLAGPEAAITIPTWMEEENGRIALIAREAHASRLISSDRAFDFDFSLRRQADAGYWSFEHVARSMKMRPAEARSRRPRF